MFKTSKTLLHIEKSSYYDTKLRNSYWAKYTKLGGKRSLKMNFEQWLRKNVDL